QPRQGPPLPVQASYSCSVCLPLVFRSVGALDIYTPGSLEAVNGTDARLKCTFRSHSPVGQRLTVTWNFQAQPKGPTEFVFYYNDQPYPPSSGRFSGRVTWDGDIHRNDASVMLWNVNPNDNGTFQCHIRNPPDVDGAAGEIRLSVVTRGVFSEIHILALSVGAACLLMIVIVVVVVTCRHWRRMRQDKAREAVEMEMPEKEKLRDNQQEKGTPWRREDA
uniref:Myelin protein zero like 2 n=1 Tax=Varanus komodoensis TaxID=61221 RepID=A0A8D2JGY9_VARKO